MVQTGFVDAATAASVKATKLITAAETVERKAVAKADVVLAQDLQSAWGTYAAAERSAVTLNARERATIGADYKKEVARAELAAVKAVAPARKTSMVAAAEANGVYHVKVTGIIADLGILGGEIKVEQVKASHSLISPATLKKWLDVLSTCGDMTVAAVKGLAQGVANLGNAAQDVGVGLLNVPAASVNFGSWASENLFFAVPDHMKIRLPYIPSPDWSKGMVTQESDFDHNVSKGCLEVAVGIFGSGAIGKLNRVASVADDATAAGRKLLASAKGGRGPATSWNGFDESIAGGPVRDLTTNRIRITARGIKAVEEHVARFGPDDTNSLMLERLRRIATGNLRATAQDLNFYAHELRELVRYRRLGWSRGVPADSDAAQNLWSQAHTATLGDYNLPLRADELLYHLDALIHLYK